MIAALAAAAGCSSDDTVSPSPSGDAEVSQAPEPVAEPAPDPAADPAADSMADTMAAIREGDVAAVLTALAQPHRVARATLGPHTLTWSAVLDVRGTTPRPALPPVNSPVVDDQHVQDDGTLAWASEAGTPPRWWLSQQNDHERGREVVAKGDRMVVRQRHRDWVTQPYEPTIVELWLDDAQRTAYDAVEFAAPRLAVAVASDATAGLHKGEALVLTLSLADAEQVLPEGRPSAQGVRRAWRDEAELTGIAGTVTLDAATGMWLAADVRVQYALLAADERRLQGSLTLTATVRPGAPPPTGAPDDPLPLPQLPRTELERQTLLEGL